MAHLPLKITNCKNGKIIGIFEKSGKSIFHLMRKFHGIWINSMRKDVQ